MILLNDSIDGESGYGLSFVGDEEADPRTTTFSKLNNSIANAGNIDIINTSLSFGEGPYGKGEIVADGAPVTRLSLSDAALDLYNGYRDVLNLAGWKSDNGYLHIDVDIDNLTSDMINVVGDVEGTTSVVVYASTAGDITGKYIPFATATGAGSADSFSVYRVYNSPYMYSVVFDRENSGSGHTWELTMNDEENENAGVLPEPVEDPEIPDIDIPDVDVPDIDDPDVDNPGGGDDPVLPDAPAKVYAEVAAYGALPAAALEQTRSMVGNVGNQVKNSRVYTRSCGFVDGYWNGEPYYNLWVNPTFHIANIDTPFDVEADIWGIEAGGDIQRDVNNRLGVFVSYRQGNYDLSGKGERYYSPVGSEIDIDSYLAGLYYRYDKNNVWAFATVYGGVQKADIKTDDGMKADTDGTEFGASLEGGYDFVLADGLYLTPELGVFYTQVNYDDVKDNMGKTAQYDDLRQIELEAGVKLSKTFKTDEGAASVYVKPSIVQTIVDGEEVKITGLRSLSGVDDATLGRIKLGGRYGFTDRLSVYGWFDYTFGSDYDAETFGVGLNYAF